MPTPTDRLPHPRNGFGDSRQDKFQWAGSYDPAFFFRWTKRHDLSPERHDLSPVIGRGNQKERESKYAEHNENCDRVRFRAAAKWRRVYRVLRRRRRAVQHTDYLEGMPHPNPCGSPRCPHLNKMSSPKNDS